MTFTINSLPCKSSSSLSRLDIVRHLDITFDSKFALNMHSFITSDYKSFIKYFFFEIEVGIEVLERVQGKFLKLFLYVKEYVHLEAIVIIFFNRNMGSLHLRLLVWTISRYHRLCWIVRQA